MVIPSGSDPPEHPALSSDNDDAAAEEVHTRQTAIGLFSLLLAFAGHASRPVTDVASYQDSLWLADVPREAGCFSRSWGPEEGRDPDTWLQIAKAQEPASPPPPAECIPWLSEEPPFGDEEPLLLQERIPAPEDDAHLPLEDGAAVPEQRFLTLADHPEIDGTWARYLNERWAPWAKAHRSWRHHHEIYVTLFRMRQTLLREDERYELVLGFGLLQHRRPEGTPIRRHLLTVPVTLEFDANHGVFTVTPPPDGARVALELDMLAEAQRPDAKTVNSLREEMETLSADPWNERPRSALLRTIVQTMHVQGEVREEVRPLSVTPGHPVVLQAPALLLRRRTARSMSAMFRRILKQLEDGETIPSGIDLLVSDGASPELTSPGDAAGTPSIPILFPKPTNDEQRKIIERLEHARGVLVQGPPGTGKSHTIGNLISHLLAQGKRVLVTAQTPRALKVLKEKIPEPIQPLCVAALGNDRASLDDLQRSVQNITGRESEWDGKEAGRRIEELHRQRASLSEELARLDGELQQLREAETIHHEVAGGAYRGTPQRIAERVAREAARFSWFEDTPSDPETALEVTPDEVPGVLEARRTLPPERIEELGATLPDPADIPATDELSLLMKREADARKDLEESRNDEVPAETLELLDAAPGNIAEELTRAVDLLHQRIVTAMNRPLSWIPGAVHEILAGDDTPWLELREQTAELLRGLAEEAHETDRESVERPADIPQQRLLADAEDLYERLSRGKSVSFINRRLDPVIRRTAYIADSVRVGGRLCNTAQQLRRLVLYLRFGKRLERLWIHWRQWCPDGETGPYTRQVARLTENLEALDQVLEVFPALEDAKRLVAKVPGLPQPAWHDEAAFHGFRQACRARIARERLEELQQAFAAIEKRLLAVLEQPNPHPVSAGILDAVRKRDESGLLELRRTLQELFDDRKRLAANEAGLERIGQQLPRLADALRKGPLDPEWDVRLRELPAAWRWACARGWLRRIQEPGRMERLSRRSKDLQAKYLERTGELASLLAWREFFTRLTPEHRQHLAAWQQAVRRLGRGTGRHAPRHRRDARKHLQQCRDAIPAWIMPLHQVYDTIAPEPAMFDVVIVDEASQCSLDALCLLYLGRKIIIVGDDEQISPTVLRFEHLEFEAMVRRHLGSFGLASVFQPDTSLFDLGRVWFGGSRVQLREHFRCMPEIIRFSDQLCYGNLLPLRQYPPERLEPLITRHVPNGYRQGSGQSVVNLPEACAVVEAVATCCRNPRYRGKTMGVISLLAAAQARLVEQQLLERLDGEEIERRRLVCGDAYSFQGDERDVMFLSMVTAPRNEQGQPINLRALTGKQDKQRFNVAASRARDQLWLFHTPTLDNLGNPDDLRRRLLLHCLEHPEAPGAPGDPNLDELRRIAASPRRREGDPPRPFDSWFEVDVYLRIRGRGYRVIPQVHVASYRIDLVVEGGQRRLAVECDGDAWHGPERFQADLHRQRQLERAGWTFWRVRGSEFYADPEAALDGLWAQLTELGIDPLFGAPARPVDRQQTESIVPPEASSAEPVLGASETGSTALGPPASVMDAPAASGPHEKATVPVATDDTGVRIAAKSSDSELVLAPEAPPAPQPAPLPLQPRQSALPREELSPVARTLGAKPYTSYAGDPLPDPHSATGRQIQDGLVAIVEAEGPIVHERLFRVYAQSAGFKRTGRQIRERLKRPLAAALRQRRLIREYQPVSDTKQVPVYRTPAQIRAPFRASGDRTLPEIPPAEIEALMHALRGDHANRPVQDPEGFLRLVLGFYGMRRLTDNARSYLKSIYQRMITPQR